MQQILRSKFLDVLLTLSLPLPLPRVTFCITKVSNSFALLFSYARHHSLFNALFSNQR